jgi:hypothetical protein
MNKLIYRTASALALMIVSGAAFATAQVTYIDTDKMTDVPRWRTDLESMEYIFNQHLNRLSEQLPAGQVLKVEFLDIDLAGDVFPRVAVRDIRILKGQADWPRMHFRYSIEQDGQVIRSGESKLSDPNYQMSINRYNQDLYGHEKQMLDDWFRKDVLQRR